MSLKSYLLCVCLYDMCYIIICWGMILGYGVRKGTNFEKYRVFMLLMSVKEFEHDEIWDRRTNLPSNPTAISGWHLKSLAQKHTKTWFGGLLIGGVSWVIKRKENTLQVRKFVENGHLILNKLDKGHVIFQIVLSLLLRWMLLTPKTFKVWSRQGSMVELLENIADYSAKSQGILTMIWFELELFALLVEISSKMACRWIHPTTS